MYGLNFLVTFSIFLDGVILCTFFRCSLQNLNWEGNHEEKVSSRGSDQGDMRVAFSADNKTKEPDYTCVSTFFITFLSVLCILRLFLSINRQ